MALFGKAKKRAGVGAPRSKAEADKVARRMRKKYPQMYDQSGVLKKEYAGEFSPAQRALQKAGVSSAEMPTDKERRARKGK